MSRRVVTATLDGPTVILTGHKAHILARGAGLKPLWNGVSRGWVLDAKRLPDLVSYLQYRNVDVEIVGDVAPTDSGAPVPMGGGSAGAPVQLDMFGGVA